MLISLDCREQYLIQECRRFLVGKEGLSHIKLEEKALPIGDIIIYNDNGDELVIIERKTMKDLASSIRDGRYSEQGYRLDACKLPNHNIFYLIEGSLSSVGPRFEKKTILSALTTISYYKGFSLYRTTSVSESAEWLVRMSDKLHRTDKPAYYKESTVNNNTNDNNTNDNNTNDNDASDYVSVCKRVKKNNITVENIGAIMLMQIPGVSNESAKTVMSKYKNIKNLIKTLEEDPNALEALTQTTKTGKKRKLNKTVKSNIYNYLVANNSGVIVLN